MQHSGARGFARIGLGIITTLFLACFFAPGVMAKQYHISDYDIDMTVTTEGSYLITERITYDFLSGSFSTAHREVPGSGFTAVHFIGIEGVDHPVTSFDAKDGRNLSLSWSYPPTSESATFVITYEAEGALRSRNGDNVIDWNPIGSGWDVPLHNIDVTIRLPQALSDIRVDPTSDLVSITNDGIVHFHRESLPAKTYYHVVVTFPEIIPIIQPPTQPYAVWIIAGLAVGMLLMVLDLRSRLVGNPKPANSGPSPSQLSPTELATVYSPTYQGRRRGIAATIFALGQAGKIQLVVPRRRRLGSSGPVHVEILNDADLSEPERLIVTGLKRRKTLQRFAHESSTFSKVIKLASSSLQEKDLISSARLQAQMKTYLSAIVPGLLGIGSLVYGGVATLPPWMGLGVLLLVLGIGRILSAASINIFTPAGLYTQQQTQESLDAKMVKLDALVERQSPKAMAVLFDDLPYLILNKKFTTSKLQRLKRHLRKVEHVEPPAWIVHEPGRPGQALEALSALETIDFVFLAIIAAAGSTGATGVAGGGAAGSGAGGGGGGAG